MIDFLQEHIIQEQKYMTWDGRFGRLDEVHGQVPGLDAALDRAWKKVQEFPEQNGYIKGTVQLQDLGIPFVESGNLDVVVVPESPNSRKGHTVDTFEVKNFRGQDVNIRIQVSSESLYEREHLFKAVLAHELTHVYERVYRISYNRPESRETKIFYKVALEYALSPDKLVRHIGTFLYSFDSAEQNAFIGQLRAELKPYALELNDSSKAIKRIKDTEAYKWYASIPHWIEKLKKESPEEQLRILAYWNELVGTGYRKSSFPDLLEYLERRWSKFWKKFMNRAGKVCFDLYDEALDTRTETFEK